MYVCSAANLFRMSTILASIKARVCWQIVSKYVSDPVLLERDDVGPVKFDLRFVVMLTSVCPLQLAVHQKFVVRVANKSAFFRGFLNVFSHLIFCDLLWLKWIGSDSAH